MKVARTIRQVRREVAGARRREKTIGLVPTMGCLHEGHMALVERAQAECGYSVVSIFVNPTQFGPREDYATYPRDLKGDLRMLKEAKVDLVFHPSVEEMYNSAHRTWLDVPDLADKLEGRFRPGHFRGVCTLVLKLLEIVRPDKAYFGWKDAQQLIIIKKMIKDLNIPVKIIGVATVREKDGLAKSSRNIYLGPAERAVAPVLYQCLQKTREMVKSKGIRTARVLLREGRRFLAQYPEITVQYLEAVNPETLKPVAKVVKGTLVAAAVKIGKTRLIDNIIMG